MQKTIKELFLFEKASIVTLQEQNDELKAKKYFHQTQTAPENRAMCFCISNDIQCIKIHNRIVCTCLVYCLDDPKQFFFYFSEKCATAAL